MQETAPGGINLNAAASVALDFLHKIEQVTLLRNTGWATDDDGSVVPTYAEPETAAAQVQDAGRSALMHVRKINDNARQKLFWLNTDVRPVDRFSEHGGDLVLYEGTRWRITARPDDFVKQGWVCVLGEAILDDD
jgi:hypothetical protein